MAMLVPAVSRRVAPSTAAQIGMTAAAYPSGAKWCSAIQNESRPTSSASKASRIMSSYSSRCVRAESGGRCVLYMPMPKRIVLRSEEHTSELQSLAYLVCRLLLEKKKKNYSHNREHQTDCI